MMNSFITNTLACFKTQLRAKPFSQDFPYQNLTIRCDLLMTW